MSAQDRVRVSEHEAKKAAVAKIDPEYPSIARQMRVTGRVQVEMSIDREGNVDNVTILNGNPLLTPAAVSATRKWRFTPFAMEGKPAAAVATLTFDFRL
jgi:protein TonB